MLQRKALSAMGIEPDKIDQIIEMHAETVNGLKDEIAKFKADAESLQTVAKERDKLQKDIDDLKAKAPDAAKVQAEYDAYKKDVETKAANAKKSEALWNKLLAEGANPDAKELLLHAANFEAVTLNEKGEADVSKAVDPIKSAYGKYFGVMAEAGAPTKTPPVGSPSPERDKMTDAEWFAAKQAAKAK